MKKSCADRVKARKVSLLKKHLRAERTEESDPDGFRSSKSPPSPPPLIFLLLLLLLLFLCVFPATQQPKVYKPFQVGIQSLKNL
jgi:hypothetical protein